MFIYSLFVVGCRTTVSARLTEP